MISILQKAWHIGTHESVLMAQTRCRNVTFRWVMKFSFRGRNFVKFKTFLEECVIFGRMCHLWRNVPFLEECDISGGMCHFLINVPFLEEFNSSLATFSNLTKRPYGKPAAFCSVVFSQSRRLEKKKKNLLVLCTGSYDHNTVSSLQETISFTHLSNKISPFLKFSRRSSEENMKS